MAATNGGGPGKKPLVGSDESETAVPPSKRQKLNSGSPLTTACTQMEQMSRLAFGLDIGGTLVKLTFFEPTVVDAEEQDHHRRIYKVASSVMHDPLAYGDTGVLASELSIESARLGGKLHFVHFATSGIATFLNIVKDNTLVVSKEQAGLTGGGSVKYAQDYVQAIGLQPACYDELDCLVVGIATLCRLDPEECYFLDLNPSTKLEWAGHADDRVFGDGAVVRKVPIPLFDSSGDTDAFPFLVVNIGTGVSILRVDSATSYERVGGTPLGGGTFYGLVRCLTGCETFEEALELAKQGDSASVDMLVGDIYGRDYSGIGLTEKTIASSFGKMINPEAQAKAKPADMAASLLVTITNNIGNLSRFVAKNEGTSKVLFVGTFLNNNSMAMRALSYGLEYWTKGSIHALFLKHQGFHGSVGALVSAHNHTLSKKRKAEEAGLGNAAGTSVSESVGGGGAGGSGETATAAS